MHEYIHVNASTKGVHHVYSWTYIHTNLSRSLSLSVSLSLSLGCEGIIRGESVTRQPLCKRMAQLGDMFERRNLDNILAVLPDFMYPTQGLLLK